MIIKCNDKNSWYKNSIGKTFIVKGEEKDKYFRANEIDEITAVDSVIF